MVLLFDCFIVFLFSCFINNPNKSFRLTHYVLGEPLGRPGRQKSPRVAKEREKGERKRKGESKS